MWPSAPRRVEGDAKKDKFERRSNTHSRELNMAVRVKKMVSDGSLVFVSAFKSIVTLSTHTHSTRASRILSATDR